MSGREPVPPATSEASTADPPAADGLPAPEPGTSFAGVPDAFQRLWTPHRWTYVGGGENKPDDDGKDECPFCRAPGRSDEESLIVHRGETCYVLLNLYPYNPGHLMVCPYRHVPIYTDITAGERAEMAELTAQAVTALSAASKPHGFNMGINQGQVAGAGIAAHLHQHVVPRWTGDANFFPILAGTKALPVVLGETRNLVAEAWGA
ncbi:MAG TPA: HIT domain-containing protein [Actinomycetaceae bacterium]|nr:HIT domain-containing protein [Actinomycetaceae bacterium]